MKKALVLLLFLTGCKTVPVETKVEVQKVNVEIPVACFPKDFPKVPENVITRERLLKATDGAERYQLLQAFWASYSPLVNIWIQAESVCKGK